MVHLAGFEPTEWLRLVRDEGITSAMLVPTMLARVVEHLDGRPADVPTLRSLAYGGARMPPTVMAATRVVTVQCPCGTLPTSRSPSGLRP